MQRNCFGNPARTTSSFRETREPHLDAMTFNTRAARAQQWKPTYTFEFEYQPREKPIPARRGKRSSCQFASATASLSEGVMSKPNVSFSPPPPKPKVRVMSWAASSIQLYMARSQDPPILAAAASCHACYGCLSSHEQIQCQDSVHVAHPEAAQAFTTCDLYEVCSTEFW